MSAKDLCINPNILTPILDGYKLEGGHTLNIVGLVPADTNLLMESFFKVVVSSQPNEDEEEDIGILYLTRSFNTAMRMERAISSVDLVARKVFIRTYNKFNGEEILELLADLEDDLSFRYVFIEDIDHFFSTDTPAEVRRIRRSNEGHLLLTVSSGMHQSAQSIYEIEQDAADTVEMVSNLTYDKNPKLANEMDVQIIALPDKYTFNEDTYITQLHFRAIMSKCRSIVPYEKKLHSINFTSGGY